MSLSELAARLDKLATLLPGPAADLRAAAQAVRERELAGKVCQEAAFFCEEINEDTGECDIDRLPQLHKALDEYEEFVDELLPPEGEG